MSLEEWDESLEDIDYAELTLREAARAKALSVLRAKCFGALASLGAGAGAMEAWYAGAGARTAFYDILTGMVAVLLAGFLGGLFGSLLHGFLTWLGRGDLEEQEDINDAVLMAGTAGGFLGLLLALLLWNLPDSRALVAAGAALGAFLGALPGETVGIMLRMIIVHEHMERQAAREERRVPAAAEASGRDG
ncbi:hypothetical protein dsx2_0788 [Desulfovibrio sp. X2]|uniref:hypothetical protein n=1 Tax=Desulfovibrio sp. X2 TaxID=941449 RepID=UPI000358E0D6|nr:hypothetical protein [Desulfovibrio sp. X2]EPR37442.1 hypothetical protein dsx2_0788 [Desulfovibrio sp. X2]